MATEAKRRKIELVVRLLPATDETFAMLRREMLEYSLSLTHEQRMQELIELRQMAFGDTLPSAKVYRGSRKLTDPDPFDP